MMESQVCRSHCLAYGKCTSLKTCKKFTDQTMYIIKYIALQPLMGTTVYPFPGTWLDQPLWFIYAFNIGMKKLSLIRKSQSENSNK